MDPVPAIRDLLQRRTAEAAREALRLAQALVAREPAAPRPQLILAEAARAAGELTEAASALQRAIERGARAPELSFNLARLLAELDRNAEALSWLDDALRQRPAFPAALNNRGELLAGMGRLDEALASLHQALIVDPAYRAARFNLGAVHRERGAWPEAIAAFAGLTELDPADRPAWVARAAVERTAGLLDEAADSLERAIALDPSGSPAELAALGSVRDENGDGTGAWEAFGRALALDTGNVAVALRHHLSLPWIYPDRAALAAARQRYANGLDALGREFTGPPTGATPDAALAQLTWCNFLLAYQGEDDRDLQSRYADWLAACIDRIDPMLRAPLDHRPSGGRIRVGFVSRFFCQTTIGNYFGRWITGLDRRRFHVAVFDLAPADDALAQAIRARADAYHALPSSGHALAAVARAIRAAELDVLVYPELGMHDVTYTLAALRLAPVQCCGWGHPVTPGHPTIDVYVTAAAMEPEGAYDAYRERLVGLPGIGTSYPHPPAPMPTADTVTVAAGGAATPAAGGTARRARNRAALGLPTDRALLLYPQSLFKIDPDNDVLVAEVLAAVPDAQLVMFEAARPWITATFRDRLGRTLAARGMRVDERCLVLPVVPRGRFLALAASCDLMLDTLHWSGGNTTLDALAVALPVVTLPGQWMRGRQSTAMLRSLELPGLVAADADDYLRIATELARNRGQREDLRREIGRRAERLFDDPAPLAAWAALLEALAAGRPGQALPGEILPPPSSRT